MTAFFIPGVPSADDRRDVELVYRDMRLRVERDMGRRPRACRIEKLLTRRGSTDCITAVGAPDPLRGGMVIAIFDMGPRQPFVVWREAEVPSHEGCREVLGPSAYSVQEFDV